MKSKAKNLDFFIKTKLNINSPNMDGFCVKNFSLFSLEDSNLKNIMKYVEDQMIFDELDRVCIISIIGKSSIKAFNSKANYLPGWFGRNSFDCRFKNALFKDQFVQIDGYYDVNNRMILLHLTSVFDTWTAVNVFEYLEKQFIDQGFLTMWPNLLSDLFKSLLLIFYVSNIVIITNPSPRFDIGCINMLRIIDSTRIKLQPFVSEMLSTHSKLPSQSYKNFLQIPQILFIFEAYDGFDHIVPSNIKFFVKQLEEQTLRLLRKTRLINSLFTFSSFNSFVFIATKSSTIIDYDEYFFEKILKRCQSSNESTDISSKKCQQTEEDDLCFSNFILPHINSLTRNHSKDNVANAGKLQSNELLKTKIFFIIFSAFKELIFKQTYNGISDEKMKNLQKILDSFHSTLDIDNRFSEGRCSKKVSSAVQFYTENLPSHYNRETHERKLMMALQHFTVQTRGPSIYKYIKMIQNECTLYWNNGHKMCEELSLTGNPCVNKVHRLPHDDFSTEQQPTSIMNAECDQLNMPIMAHNSMVKIISACDCGRRQGNREDPFTVKAANYDFYLIMKYKCHNCRQLSRYKFPVYESHQIDLENLSSTSQNMNSKCESRDSPVMTNNQTILSQDDLSNVDDKNDCSGDMQHDLILSIENLSNNGNNSISLNNDEQDNCFSNEIIDKLKNDKSSGSKSDENLKSLQQQDNNSSSSQSSELEEEEDDDEDEYSQGRHFISEEEFIGDLDGTPAGGGTSHSPPNDTIFDVKNLPPMIHTLLHDDLPARFSSWSLVCFGPSRIYSHNLGIQDQQGFVKGSHYLLPWNVTVILQRSKNMPPLWEGKRPPGIKHKRIVKDGTQFTVKIFIGVEYECFKGHRFIASAPNQVLNATTHKFRETAEPVANNDMPLYMQCVCSSSGDISIAQLMRIHIVTPKAPISVTLNPKIQVTPNPNLLFYPGNREPIKLSQSSYWVLRLPMIYESMNDGPYRFPKNNNESIMPYCRLLKGCYDIADIVNKVK